MAEITPNDIINKEFRMALRGYTVEQVDEFLQQVSDRMFYLMEDNRRLQLQLDEAKARIQQYEQTETLLKNTLLLAERTAEETRANALQEAELMRREAEQRVQHERAAIEDLKASRLRMVTELRAFLHAQLAMLDEQGRDPSRHLLAPTHSQGE